MQGLRAFCGILKNYKGKYFEKNAASPPNCESWANDFSSAIGRAINDGNCDCEGCSLSDTCCSVPLTFSSETPGILNVSDLRVIYEPTDYDKANLDGEDPIDFNDLSLFAEDYARTGGYLIGDIDRDGKTDFQDFALPAEYWLTLCDCN